MTQREAAEAWDVSLFTYRRWERDVDDDAPAEKIGRLEPYEACHIKRRRAGMTIAEVAEGVGCCRWWIHQMENGDVDPAALVDYWRGLE